MLDGVLRAQRQLDISAGEYPATSSLVMPLRSVVSTLVA